MHIQEQQCKIFKKIRSSNKGKGKSQLVNIQCLGVQNGGYRYLGVKHGLGCYDEIHDISKLNVRYNPYFADERRPITLLYINNLS